MAGERLEQGYRHERGKSPSRSGRHRECGRCSSPRCAGQAPGRQAPCSPRIRFCDGDVCSIIKDGLPILRDLGHYNEWGSKSIIGRFAEWAKQYNVGVVE